MDTYDVKRLALVLAVQAEIEGMKALNRYLNEDLLTEIKNYETKDDCKKT